MSQPLTYVPSATIVVIDFPGSVLPELLETPRVPRDPRPIIRESVTRHGGRTTFFGDGAACVFSDPDAANSAVAAALQVRDALLDLRPHIAIATGPIYEGTPGPPGAALPATLGGPAFDQAWQLIRQCRHTPDRVVMCTTTASLLTGIYRTVSLAVAEGTPPAHALLRD